MPEKSGYLQELDRWLDAVCTDLADGKLTYAELKRSIKSRVLDSYKNGVKAGRQSPAPRREASRRFERRQTQRA